MIISFMILLLVGVTVLFVHSPHKWIQCAKSRRATQTISGNLRNTFCNILFVSELGWYKSFSACLIKVPAPLEKRNSHSLCVCFKLQVSDTESSLMEQFIESVNAPLSPCHRHDWSTIKTYHIYLNAGRGCFLKSVA